MAGSKWKWGDGWADESFKDVSKTKSMIIWATWLNGFTSVDEVGLETSVERVNVFGMVELVVDGVSRVLVLRERMCFISERMSWSVYPPTFSRGLRVSESLLQKGV